MKVRIHNANVDVEIEGEDEQDIMDQFSRDYPSEKHNVIFIEPIEGGWGEAYRRLLEES